MFVEDICGASTRPASQQAEIASVWPCRHSKHRITPVRVRHIFRNAMHHDTWFIAADGHMQLGRAVQLNGVQELRFSGKTHTLKWRKSVQNFKQDRMVSRSSASKRTRQHCMNTAWTLDSFSLPTSVMEKRCQQRLSCPCLCCPLRTAQF